MNLKQIEPVVESLAKGPIVRKTLALTLRVLTGVLIFAGLFVVLGAIGEIINIISFSATQALGIMLSLVLVIVGFVLAVKILLFRARTILISQENDYPIIHLSALLLRTGGELLVLFYSVVGIVSGIMIWFGGDLSIPILWHSFFSPGLPPFILGLGIILFSLTQAIFSFILFYLGAELLLLLRNIATKR